MFHESIDKRVKNGTIQTQFWCHVPGVCVNQFTGERLNVCDFNGTISDWYSTLMERVADCSATILATTQRYAANCVAFSVDCVHLFDYSNEFRVTHEALKEGEIYSEVELRGTISGKWEARFDPYLPKRTIVVFNKDHEDVCCVIKVVDCV